VDDPTVRTGDRYAEVITAADNSGNYPEGWAFLRADYGGTSTDMGGTASNFSQELIGTSFSWQTNGTSTTGVDAWIYLNGYLLSI
jgi:hypothetical protein